MFVTEISATTDCLIVSERFSWNKPITTLTFALLAHLH